MSERKNLCDVGMVTGGVIGDGDTRVPSGWMPHSGSSGTLTAAAVEGASILGCRVEIAHHTIVPHPKRTLKTGPFMSISWAK